MAIQTDETVLAKDFPESTKKRLIELEALLASWQGEKITSAKICELTGWKDSLVRHDLWMIKKVVPMLRQCSATAGSTTGAGMARGWKNGYDVAMLRESIRTAFRRDSENDSVRVCIAGLGRLGAALLDDSLFEKSQFEIKAGFDSNVNRVEILRSTFPLYPAAEMNWVIKQEKITLAILTVADKDAQTMCDRLVKAGITGIVNMTNSVLRVPQNVKVENLSIVNSLKIIG